MAILDYQKESKPSPLIRLPGLLFGCLIAYHTSIILNFFTDFVGQKYFWIHWLLMDHISLYDFFVRQYRLLGLFMMFGSVWCIIALIRFRASRKISGLCTAIWFSASYMTCNSLFPLAVGWVERFFEARIDLSAKIYLQDDPFLCSLIALAYTLPHLFVPLIVLANLRSNQSLRWFQKPVTLISVTSAFSATSLLETINWHVIPLNWIQITWMHFAWDSDFANWTRLIKAICWIIQYVGAILVLIGMISWLIFRHLSIFKLGLYLMIVGALFVEINALTALIATLFGANSGSYHNLNWPDFIWWVAKIICYPCNFLWQCVVLYQLSQSNQSTPPGAMPKRDENKSTAMPVASVT